MVACVGFYSSDTSDSLLLIQSHLYLFIITLIFYSSLVSFYFYLPQRFQLKASSTEWSLIKHWQEEGGVCLCVLYMWVCVDVCVWEKRANGAGNVERGKRQVKSYANSYLKLTINVYCSFKRTISNNMFYYLLFVCMAKITQRHTFPHLEPKILPSPWSLPEYTSFLIPHGLMKEVLLKMFPISGKYITVDWLFLT